MTPIAVADGDDPRLADFRDPHTPRDGRVVAEGAVLVRRLCEARGWRIRAVLATDAAHATLADRLPTDVPVYVAARPVLETVAGYPFHRGLIAIAERPPSPSLDALLEGTGPLVVLERVSTPDNVGAIVRAARAFGAGGVVLSPGCADPFAPKALRASAGHAFHLPIVTACAWPGALATLRTRGVHVLALSTDLTSVDLRRVDAPGGRLAVLAGSEAEGISPGALAHTDVRTIIPMARDADSLNVATAVAIALYAITRGG